MTCEEFTKELNKYPKIHYGSKGFFYYNENNQEIIIQEKDIPKNGIYVMFENGETCSHTTKNDDSRVVRIGINELGEKTLVDRLLNHFKGQRGKSIFRKHISSSIINSHIYDKDIPLPKQVSNYIQQNVSFIIIKDNDNNIRHYELPLIGLVNNCSTCNSSEKWLGKVSPNPKISNGKLWNIQGLKNKYVFTNEDKKTLFENIYDCRKV